MGSTGTVGRARRPPCLPCLLCGAPAPRALLSVFEPRKRVVFAAVGVLIFLSLLLSRLWTNVFIIMLLVLCLSEDRPVQAEVLMYLYVFSILNDFINLVIWGPWDRETSTMRFSLTMASVNLIIKPFLTPAVLELVKRNGSSASIGGGGMVRHSCAACVRQ